jgi:hypothetical protein
MRSENNRLLQDDPGFLQEITSIAVEVGLAWLAGAAVVCTPNSQNIVPELQRVWLVQSDKPITWVFFPTILYGVLGFLGYHRIIPPTPLDRIAQTIGVLFPALASIAGGAFGKSMGTLPRGAVGPKF